MKSINFFSLLLIIILFSKCLTNPRPITGGDSDTIAPLLLHKSTTKNKVILTFDENMAIKNEGTIITNQIKAPSYTIRQNKLIIKHQANDKKLVIDFNDNLADINEGNVLQNFFYTQYLFEDTFSINGKISTLFKDKDKYENTYIVLYYNNLKLNNKEDLYNFNFTKVKMDSNYSIKYCSNPSGGSLFAFRDNNNNLVLDSLDDYGNITLDSSNKFNQIFISNNRREIIGIDTINDVIKFKLKDEYSYVLQNRNHQGIIDKNYLINYSLKDTIIFNKTNNIIRGDTLFIYNNSSDKNVTLDTTFFTLLKENKWYVKPVYKDTQVVVKAKNDTLLYLQLTADKNLSSVIFNIKRENNIPVRGLLKNAFFSYFIDLTQETQYFLTKGSYSLFLYMDENNNGTFDKNITNLKPSIEKVLFNAKVIDIGNKMDVDINL